jgi:hypothetical protein
MERTVEQHTREGFMEHGRAGAREEMECESIYVEDDGRIKNGSVSPSFYI